MNDDVKATEIAIWAFAVAGAAGLVHWVPIYGRSLQMGGIHLSFGPVPSLAVFAIATYVLACVSLALQGGRRDWAINTMSRKLPFYMIFSVVAAALDGIAFPLATPSLQAAFSNVETMASVLTFQALAYVVLAFITDNI